MLRSGQRKEPVTKMNDLEQQRDEILALSSIYGEEFILEEFTSDYQVYSMEFKNNAKTVEVRLTTKLPSTYPSTSPPTFEVSSPYLNGKVRSRLGQRLEAIYMDNIGQPVLYQWFEEVRQFVAEFTDESSNVENLSNDENIPTTIDASANATTVEESKIVFTTGQPIVDRKSTFQGHVAQVFSRRDVLLAMQQLKLNTKIERATHNIYSYRIQEGNIFQQDCDDDGESQAGSRLLHLLQLVDAKNVLIVVSRWYGGIHLGAARFKHINNAARQVLEENGEWLCDGRENQKSLTKYCRQCWDFKKIKFVFIETNCPNFGILPSRTITISHLIYPSSHGIEGNNRASCTFI